MGVKNPVSISTWRSAIFVFSVVAITAGGRERDDLLTQARQHFKPIPATTTSVSDPRVELGRKLFFDPRFSSDGTISCMKCHQPALYGADGLPKSLGVGSKVNARNAPTILNVGTNTLFHWHADRSSIEDQAAKSLAGPNFGNPDQATVLSRINKIPGYQAEFQTAYPDDAAALNYQNAVTAIATFERTLVSRSAFDSYLDGNESSLPQNAQAGLKTFIDVGCVKCHDGIGVGGEKLKKFGVHDDYWKYTGSNPVDKGRFEATNDQNDLYRFKVPSLRNVARTAPYFHDGSVASLSQAITIMAKIQLNTDLTIDQVQNITAFLDSLTGDIPTHFATAPILPPGAFNP